MLSWAPGCSEDRLSPPQLVCGLTSKILAYRSPFPAAGQPQLELPYFANRKAWPWIKTGFSEEPSLRRLPQALGKRGGSRGSSATACVPCSRSGGAAAPGSFLPAGCSQERKRSLSLPWAGGGRWGPPGLLFSGLGGLLHM